MGSWKTVVCAISFQPLQAANGLQTDGDGAMAARPLDIGSHSETEKQDHGFARGMSL